MYTERLCRTGICNGLCIPGTRTMESSQREDMRMRNGRGRGWNLLVRNEAHLRTQTAGGTISRFRSRFGNLLFTFLLI